MEQLIVKEIIQSTGGTLIRGALEDIVKNISTDSRNLDCGDFFVPLEGNKFDGHNFIKEIYLKQAQGFLFSQDSEQIREIVNQQERNLIVIKVDSTLFALQKIAGYYRAKMKVKVIGITGSNGKTTTKDMIKTVLQSRYKTIATEGTLNNHIGVPLTLLQMSSLDEIAVIELGMSARGEIDNLGKLSRPQLAVITNVGESHLEFFSSLEEIAKAKAEIIKHLPKKGVLFLNVDDKYVKAMGLGVEEKVVTFGVSEEAEYRAAGIKSTGKGILFNLVLSGKETVYELELPVLGKHNVYNALAAIAVGLEIGLSLTEIKESLSKFNLPDKRLKSVRAGGVNIVNDAYNANPDSVRAAIETIDEMEVKGKKVFVFGEMKELGEASYLAHKKIGQMVADSSIESLITFGEDARLAALEAFKQGMKKELLYIGQDKKDLREFLISILKDGDLVLIKGSRTNYLEEIETYLVKHLGSKKNLKTEEF